MIGAISKAMVKIFGSRNDRLVKSYFKRVEQINAQEAAIRPLADSELAKRVTDCQERISNGASSSDVLPEALAIIREAIDRNIGIRSIFNPEHNFDPSVLPDPEQQLYKETLDRMNATPPARRIGTDETIPGWQQVDIPVPLYDAVRELYPKSRPPFRARPFDVQLIGGMVLSEGKIAEMKTGEGKTFVAPLACFMAIMEGLQCHVITVNDYLVQRDSDWVFPAFYKLGISVAAIHPFHMQPSEQKKEAYGCDIVYGTSSEFGFDYLRDNMKLSLEDQVQRKREFCIIDEVDSILIDEARTPLIISGPAHDDRPQYNKANEVAERLKALQFAANVKTNSRLKEEGFIEKQANRYKVSESAIEKVVAKFRDLGPEYLIEKEAEQIDHQQYYVMKPEQKQAYMTSDGVEIAQDVVGTRFYVVGNDMAWDHLINQAVRAHSVYEKDRDYVVENGEVVIIDENTGRKMIGRQWSDGLHQAIEAKESRHGVKIKEETQTLATVTVQNFFNLYHRLAGMTGTAITEATEFHEIYKLDVVVIPTNLPVVRADEEDVIYLTERAKWIAIIDEIVSQAKAGRPVLVGTTSVEKSERLSAMLSRKYELPHEVLNAKQHEREANIVANAGKQAVDEHGNVSGAITIATNMAGRGTDIKLSQDVIDAGGLHIIGTERHESRRIDNQLRGRAGRQGDPGSSRFYISMEDDLMKMFAGKNTMKALSMFGMQEDDAIEHKWLSKSVERAQRKVEERNFQQRKSLLEYDEVMEYQRSDFYGLRQSVLEGADVRSIIQEYIIASTEDAVGYYLDRDFISTQVSEAVLNELNCPIPPGSCRADNLAELQPRVRSFARDHARQDIENNIYEFFGEGDDQSARDLKGIKQWAMVRFKVDLKIAAMNKQTNDEIIEELERIAFELIERKSLDFLEKFFSANYAGQELAGWAERKFSLELDPLDLDIKSGESNDVAQQRVADAVYSKIMEAYDEREITYPISYHMDIAQQYAEQGRADIAAAGIAMFANERFAVDWTPEHVGELAQDGEQLYQSLVDESRSWRDQKLRPCVEAAVKEHGSDEQKLKDWFAERFQRPLSETPSGADRLEHIHNAARDAMRIELTHLESHVLLQVLDQTWKDHLYAMDHLKDSIGLVGYAEKDPKIVYKTEASHMYQEMKKSVRDQVTDLAMRSRMTPNVRIANVYGDEHQAQHAVSESTGVSASDMAERHERDLAAAERAGGEERQVTATIVNKGPKVKRNDPCPCGSGKKYKQCCGK